MCVATVEQLLWSWYAVCTWLAGDSCRPPRSISTKRGRLQSVVCVLAWPTALCRSGKHWRSYQGHVHLAATRQVFFAVCTAAFWWSWLVSSLMITGVHFSSTVHPLLRCFFTEEHSASVCQSMRLLCVRWVALSLISIWRSNVRPSVCTYVRPQKVFPILMKFGM